MNCTFCKKQFESISGYYKHNKTYHPELLNKIKKTEQTKCDFCNKELSSYGCKWRHEKSCKQNPKFKLDINKKLQEMQEKIDKLEKNAKIPAITNNTTNNNTTNTQNVICVFPLGNEPANVLSLEYINKTLSENGINSVMDIVKKKHFNPELPQLQNFCVTALNNNYASVVDPETKTIKSVNKKDVFDKVYAGVVSNVNQIIAPDDKVKETINKIKNIPVSKKILKKLHCGINEEAYHNRNLVKKTWCVFSIAKATALALKSAKFTEQVDEKRKPIDLNNVSDDSDDSDLTVSDSSDDSCSKLKTTKVKTNPMTKFEAIKQIQKLLDEINSQQYIF